MKPPVVSICIPSYKQTDYLRRSLESISIQKYSDFEIIITDDSPDDSVKNLLEEFNFNGKLKYFKNKERLNTPENWNEAIKHASGEYIKMLHHDDWFKDENSLSDFVDMLDKNPIADFAFSSSEAMDEKKSFLFLHEPSNKQLKSLKNSNILYFGNFIGAPSSTIYRKNISLKYDKKLKWLVDVDFYIKILNINNNFVYSKKPLIQITARGNHQVTREVEKNRFLQAEESIYLYKKIRNNLNLMRYLKFLIKLIYSSNLLPLIKEFPSLQNDMGIKDIIIIKKIRESMINIRKIIRKLFNMITIFKNKYKHVSYSQCGEDLIVKYIFDQLRISKPTYLDLGAHHPKYISNTYLFYENGSTGVCVEPDPFLFKKFKKIRNKDKNLNIGVGTSDNKEADFYIMSSSTLSTFSKEEANRFVKNEGQKIKCILKVPIFSINQIIIDHFKNFPNFISIDIEGLDFDVLKSFDFKKFNTEVFCVETLTFTEGANETKLENIIKLMKEKGYFVYADTYINTIFVNNQIWINRHEKY